MWTTLAFKHDLMMDASKRCRRIRVGVAKSAKNEGDMNSRPYFLRRKAIEDIVNSFKVYIPSRPVSASTNGHMGANPSECVHAADAANICKTTVNGSDSEAHTHSNRWTTPGRISISACSARRPRQVCR
jgi:hypothetical protein